MGNVLTMMERTDDEFTKFLQNTDAHSTDYVTKYGHFIGRGGKDTGYHVLHVVHNYLHPLSVTCV